MRADILTLKALFKKDVRYLVPTFQRPYVWNQDDQWEPLWDDVRNTAERYLDHLRELGEDPAAKVKAEEAARPHFMGAVVLQQHPTPTSAIEERHVIDGQQRLTTLQLLLDAAQEVFERQGLAVQAKHLSHLVLNDEDYGSADPDHIFKVWPTNLDRTPFRHAMHNGLAVDEHAESLIVQAHEFFQLQMGQWLDEAGDEVVVRADALVTTLMGLLQTVVIDLEHADDAYVIFETLNARGTPLIASDLVKNLILHVATEGRLDADEIYRKYWQPFEEEWWRREIGQGRIVRPRVDVFLNYWLTMKTGEEVSASDVFKRFGKYVDESEDGIEEVAADLARFAGAYKSLSAQDPTSPEGTFIYRWEVMDAGVVTPALLWLFSLPPTELPERTRRRSLLAIESYLLRRMVCRMTTKDYNRLFLDLMPLITAPDRDRMDDLIVQFLSQQTSESRIWPNDRFVISELKRLPLYRLLTRSRLRIVLEGIEEALRTPKAEEQAAPRGLTIEHVMPQSWREYWPISGDLSEPEIEAAATERDRLVHTLGNLTLVNAKLNPALSNGAWSKKRTGLEEHSVLYLNKKLLESTSAAWDEAQIEARSEGLASALVKIWPSASAI